MSAGHGSAHSTGPAPCCASSSLARENGREPKKPDRAESGEGWALAMIGTSPRSFVRFWASRPHRMATSGPPRATSAEIAADVTASQPLPRWEALALGRTVSTRLSSSTPASAHGDRSPVDGLGTPRSDSNSM